MLFEADAFSSHEQVVFAHDPDTGLRAIIAIHDSSRGPAVGGCRMWPYASEDDALRDVLRLSRGMSFKSALAELPLGGGKSVILADPRHDKTDALLHSFGRRVDALGGRYVAAEDMGMGVRDIEAVGRETRYVAGRATGRAASGDPSPLTARGVFAGIRAAVRHRLQREDLAGLRVAVQGVGRVGSNLCGMLSDAGVRLWVADLHEPAVREAAGRFGATPLDCGEILAADVDVFAPCALGSVIDDVSLPRLRARVVAGAANNQLAEPRHGDELAERGVLYAPDYVINAGGVINVAGELAGAYDPDAVIAQVDAIGERLTALFRDSEANGIPPHRTADAIADARMAAARGAVRRQREAEPPGPLRPKRAAPRRRAAS